MNDKTSTGVIRLFDEATGERFLWMLTAPILKDK